MKPPQIFGKCAAVAVLAATTTSALTTVSSVAAPTAKAKVAKKAKISPVKKTSGAARGMVALKLSLPQPAFLGTPKNIPPGSTVEKPTGKPRPTVYVPVGTKNVARGKSVSSSDTSPIVGTPDLITDGDKEAGDGHYIELGPGSQWVQIDLGKTYALHAIALWHYHGEARIYRDVLVQVADDPDFIENVRTVFNNDQDNSSGHGLGRGREYFEVAEGKLLALKGARARYVRLYSRGSTADEQNHYTEVEVYGK